MTNSEKKFVLKRLAEYTDEQMLAEIRRVAELIPSQIITKKEFSSFSRVSTHTLKNHFGGWREALAAAGLADRCHLHLSITQKMREQVGKTVSRKEFIAELQRVAKKLDKESITKDEFNTHSRMAAGIALSRIGSWKAALKEAGLSVVAHGRRYTDDECFENLLTVWSYHGRPPKYLEMNLSPSTVGAKAYVVRWGTWNKALHAFVQRVDSDTKDGEIRPSPKPQNISSHERKSKQLAEERREIPLGLRWRVLTRDHFRCVKDGRSPATGTTQMLHVDHIVPFSKGGRTILENLQTLCLECNLGKGNTLEND